MKTTSYSARNGKLLIGALVQEIGEDLLVSIWGGTRPHIGAVGMAVPRPSLADSRRWSATSSNFTFTGHKVVRLVKDISEAVAQIKLCSLAELSMATCQTAAEFFPKL